MDKFGKEPIKNIYYQTKLKIFDKRINNLTYLTFSKEDLIKTQNEIIKIFTDRINDFQNLNIILNCKKYL